LKKYQTSNKDSTEKFLIILKIFLNFLVDEEKFKNDLKREILNMKQNKKVYDIVCFASKI
jgi:site-specific recombinase XerD